MDSSFYYSLNQMNESADSMIFALQKFGVINDLDVEELVGFQIQIDEIRASALALVLDKASESIRQNARNASQRRHEYFRRHRHADRKSHPPIVLHSLEAGSIHPPTRNSDHKKPKNL